MKTFRLPLYCGRLVASILCPEFFRVTKRGARSNLPASLRERTQSQTEKGRRRKSTLQADRSITLSALCIATAALQADYAPQTENTPFIEYHNRMAVFTLNHLIYERIKPNAIYAGVEGWALLTVNNKISAILEGEFRLGYNYFWNGRDHFTPLVGVGVFKDVAEYEDGRPAITYGTVGFLYDHEFTDVFNLGLNVKGVLGGPVSKKHFDWGSPIVGIDTSLPITFRFGYQRHWDFRLEPFNLYLHGSNASADYFGFRSTIGYRF